MEFPVDGSDEILRFFKALAHESRLKLVGFLAQRERSGQELAGLADLKEPTVSHHLAILREAGLVRTRGEGTTRWHALDTEALSSLASRILNPEQIGRLASGVEPADWAARVLESFRTADGRLKEIPASRRKREVVLAWLVSEFEEGRRYREAEVNECLKRRHPDFATLRREFIGYRMMARDRGHYWRLPMANWTTEIRSAQAGGEPVLPLA